MASRCQFSRVLYGLNTRPTYSRPQFHSEIAHHVSLQSRRNFAGTPRINIAWSIGQNDDETGANTRTLVAAIFSKRGSSHHYLPARITSSRRAILVRINSALLEDHIEDLCACLYRIGDTGLLPLIVHETTQYFPNEAKEVNCETLMDVRTTLLEDNLKLAESMESWGVRAAPITSGLFKATFKDRDKHGLQGVVSGVQINQFQDAVRSSRIPVIMCMAETRWSVSYDPGRRGGSGAFEDSRPVEDHLFM